MLKNVNLGAIYMLASALSFAIMGIFTKLLSGNLSSLEVVFFRNIISVIIIFISIVKSPLNNKGGKPWLLFFRGFMGFSALLAFFYNIATIPLANAMTFSQTSPIFTAIFAFIFLKERIGKLGWIAIAIGFFGLLLFTKPEIGFNKNDFLGIFSGVGAGLAYTSIRGLRQYYDTRTIVLSFALIGTIGPAVLMIVGSFYTNPSLDFMLSPFITPKGIDFIHILGIGIFATIAQIFMTKSYEVSKAGLVAPLSYANIPFSMVFGFLLGDTLPDFSGFMGIILIIFAGILISRSK
ncbi:EamA/RhaT family transporter, type 1 [Campylobacter blaseri]|uniref:EamA family transporter n=1 Tax=Campylobacter blaseri TaxID=2042961 RepID=A0A2P8R2I6_9BACT|nr:DMT family transporter [Campylobacter blaseri]PSM52678.1 EamA family transporter [Campylobacter blaseri]PSM54326.1 EamA family transporter [Campylobacter blaseri]QKF85978.1 EamA/RhaT family transporter, type 1 [Campylobacter blaseri]